MNRAVPAAIVCSLVAIGGTAWAMLAPGTEDGVAASRTSAPNRAGTEEHPIAATLRAARRTCTVAALDEVVQDLRDRARTTNEASSWQLLAEALLERAQMRSHRRGIVVGTPLHDRLPPELQADLDSGLAAVAMARQLGDDDGDLFRVEAGLLGQRITGIGTALQWNGRIQEALAQAVARAKDDPRLGVALGLRKLLAPKLLGHDPAGALVHFEFAAEHLPDDERPAVLAAMANWLQKRRQQAIAWLERAVARNPDNVFARVVLARLRRDEPDPFGRDVTDAEAVAAK